MLKAKKYENEVMGIEEDCLIDLSSKQVAIESNVMEEVELGSLNSKVAESSIPEDKVSD